MRRLLALIGLMVLAPGLVAAAPFRLASQANMTSPCRPLTPDAPAGQRALHKLLALRLGVDVLDCPVAGLAGQPTRLLQAKLIWVS